MKMQTGADYRVQVSGKVNTSKLQKMNEDFHALANGITERMNIRMREVNLEDGLTGGSRAYAFASDNNQLTRNEIKKYIKLFKGKGGHFDTPQPGGSDSGDYDLAIYTAPFDESSYRWSYSAYGSDFHIDESSNRVADAGIGITANQIVTQLGVDGVGDSIYLNSENVSSVLINHTMKMSGKLSVIAFMQCVKDSDEVKILDHSQVFTWTGNVGLGYSETKDTHALYLDFGKEPIGKASFYSSDVVPFDTDDHDYTNLDENIPAELLAPGIDSKQRLDAGQSIPLWIGTGCTADLTATGQEIRINTFQSWRFRSVWVITEK